MISHHIYIIPKKISQVTSLQLELLIIAYTINFNLFVHQHHYLSQHILIQSNLQPMTSHKEISLVIK